MRHLFLEGLLADIVDGRAAASPRYVEDLGYSVAPDGSPYVESVSAGETITATEIRAEQDDADEEPRGTRTLTFVQAEAEDWEASFASGRTETAIRGEDPDFSEWAATTTFTKVQNEAEDRD